MALPIEQQLAALRSEIATSIGELSQKTDATNAVLEARTEALAALGKQMSEVSDGVKACTEEVFRETEVGFVAESQRTTRLVESFESPSTRWTEESLRRSRGNSWSKIAATKNASSS